MRIGSLFSGIGGLEMGLEWSGLGHTIWQVEQKPFCQKILAQHWPNAKRYDDVRTVSRENLAPVDLICGGFPCQDISSQGKREGLAGSRSGLWFEYLRIVRELRPEWVVIENVKSGAKLWVDAVCQDLAGCEYATLPIPLHASDVGAPHMRGRIFIVARSLRYHPKTTEIGSIANCNGSRQRPRPWAQFTGFDGSGKRIIVSPAPPLCRVDDGVPDRAHRIEALGNAVVPQCAEVVGHVIQELIAC